MFPRRCHLKTLTMSFRADNAGSLKFYFASDSVNNLGALIDNVRLDIGAAAVPRTGDLDADGSRLRPDSLEEAAASVHAHGIRPNCRAAIARAEPGTVRVGTRLSAHRRFTTMGLVSR
jgi:hypothetical protein